MDNGQRSLLNWANYCRAKSKEELRHSLFCSTLELENTRQAVQEEIKKRDEQITNLEELLDKMVREKNEDENRCRRLLLEKFLMQQQTVSLVSGISSIEDEPRGAIDSNNTFSSSDCEESIVSSPGIDTLQPRVSPASTSESTLELVAPMPLPEKGELLRAVLKAGPLLQTLLLAGPLPQWRHPPPSLATSDIPVVKLPSSPKALTPPPPPTFFLQDTIINTSSASSNIIEDFPAPARKRSLCDTGNTYAIQGKYPRTVLPEPVHNYRGYALSRRGYTNHPEP